MELFQTYAAAIIPLLILEYGLAIGALIHVIKHPNYRFGNKVIWIIVVLGIQVIGPVVYFVFGRGEEE
ncbi:PLDc N-terminal domain-containing protein [Anaeromicropila populeti]|uniref:Phospholipase_D-nuclease N-terminal n=1 Tax=Anaeromicropila populeti TaxID=37658 RepID=A0A1I6JCR2_9FIRM|nr:PLD nuclease N-terminal domain-containing protein [Anaeromicropila populeti]SFR76748.1 Phospholipase_D-nuclease N-terminal [Anaeromicropila populeti]